MNYVSVFVKEFIDLFEFKRIRNELIKNRRLSNSNIKIDTVHCITYRAYSMGGGGGGGAVMSTQARLISNIDEVSVKYTFKEDEEDVGKKGALSEFIQPLLFVLKNTLNDKAAVYLTHDICCAYALALMGKKYILVYHSQGPRLEERKGFKEKFGSVSKRITKEVEKLAFEKADYVCFPSRGAYEYYCSSPFRSTNKENFVFGAALYNTVEPREEAYPQIDYIKESYQLRIVSIGQLTSAKGIDQSIVFLEHLLKVYKGNVHYTLIGRGKQKKQLIEKLENIKKYDDRFNYNYFPQVNYDEMKVIQKQSDCLLMLHRVAIFDLSILEMMSLGKIIILSDVWGNKEYNLENNIVYFKGDYGEAINNLLNLDVRDVCYKNRKIANEFFSKTNFVKSYTTIMKQLLNKDNE